MTRLERIASLRKQAIHHKRAARIARMTVIEQERRAIDAEYELFQCRNAIVALGGKVKL